MEVEVVENGMIDGRYRYTAERLQKTENVVEKYKKKLEESAGLRREFKVCFSCDTQC